MDIKSEVDESICPKCNNSTEDGATINCDYCRYWFHLTCVEVSDNDDCVINEDVPYYCPTCTSLKGLKQYKYTCPKCPLVSTLNETQKHCKLVHSSKSNNSCLDCKNKSLFSCPAVLRQEGDDTKMEKELMSLSILDVSDSTYYYCTYCELLRYGKTRSISQTSLSSNSPEPMTSIKSGFNIKVEPRKREYKQILMSEIRKVEGKNEIYSYETEQLGLNGEKINQKIQIGMVPPNNCEKIRNKWKGYKCPKAEFTGCKYMTKELKLLKAHLDLLHKEG